METYMEVYNRVSNEIDIKLSKSEKRFVVYKTRALDAKYKPDINSLIKNKKYLPGDFLKNVKIADAIYRILSNIGISDNDIHIYWMYNRLPQKESHDEYSNNGMKNLPKQDNKSYIAKGNGHSHMNKIRYPKKCRKTAWKRFYKLFPHLKPENNE